MGLILFFIVLTALGAYFTYLIEKNWDQDYFYCNTFAQVFAMAACVTGGIALVICVFGIIYNNIMSAGEEAGLLTQREALVYQLENKVYEYNVAGADLESITTPEGTSLNNNINSFTVVEGKRDLYKEITEFNKTVNSNKGWRNNFLTNIFYPSFWETIEPIPLQ